jgi:hypothetical protein
MLRGALLVATAVLLSLSFLPTGQSNTVMLDSGHPIVFTSQGGNEWWVQVALSAQGAGSVIGVDSMDTGGPWVTMTAHPDWGFGVYAASYHIEPGHQVRFLAHWSGGGQQTSCWFTHPQGVEQCPTTTSTTTSTTSSSSTTTSSSGFDATFTGVRGNEWWVQSNVAAVGGTLGNVDVRLNSDAWQPLTHQSWGGWAASYHIVQGTIVQLRATSTTGALDFSDCYQWIPASGADATQVSCRIPPPPPPPPPTAVFYDNLQGNEWWIQAQAHSKSPVSGVDTRVNGGTWIAMTLHDYGWAVSTHAPAGSHVQFRARFPDGTYAFIPNGYVWTAATQWPPQTSNFDAKFENTDHGNWNWVQVNVYAPSNWGLKGVSASVDNRPYEALHLQPWGDWAAPLQTFNGSYVRFAAEAPNGNMAVSDLYVWPSGRLVGAWPVEGSFAAYHLSHGFTSPGGGYSVGTQADLRLTYHAGAWSGTCTGRTQESSSDSPSDPYVVYHDYTWTYAVHEGPPSAPAPPQVGSSYNFHPLEASEYTAGDSGSCGHGEHISLVGAMTNVQTHLKDRAGTDLVLPVWQAHHDPADSTPVADDLWWDTRLGLLLQFDHSAQDGGGTMGWMTDTDAPIR